MNTEFAVYERSFESAQEMFNGDIDTTDRSKLVVPGNPEETLDFYQDNKPNADNFYPVRVESELLREQPALFVNRALLMHNPRINALSPVIITTDPNSLGKFQITMFDQPYDPKVGFSPGMHWNISLKAQARASGFGEHGPKASGLEQGHFGAAILGAYDKAVGQAIINRGDKGTHGQVLDKGVPEVMGQSSMLPVAPITRDLPPTFVPLMAYWHDKLQDDVGPISGDYPESTRLMLGAGLHAIGQDGIIKLEELVKDAVRGA